MDFATRVAVKLSGPILLRVFHTKRQETSHVAETPNYIPLTKQNFMSQTTKLHYHPGRKHGGTPCMHFFHFCKDGRKSRNPRAFPRPVLTKFLGPERLSAQSGSSVRSVPCPRQISLQARMAPPTLALLIPANPAQRRPIIFNSAVGLGSPRNCHCAGLLSATVFWNARSPLFRSFKKGPARPKARRPVKPADCSAPFELF